MSLAPGHAEGHQPGVRAACVSAHPREEGLVLGVAQRVAALDVVHAQAVQGLGDQQLVLQRQADALGLRAVAEGRVVDLDSLLVTVSWWLIVLPAPPAKPIGWGARLRVILIAAGETTQQKRP